MKKIIQFLYRIIIILLLYLMFPTVIHAATCANTSTSPPTEIQVLNQAYSPAQCTNPYPNPIGLCPGYTDCPSNTLPGEQDGCCQYIPAATTAPTPSPISTNTPPPGSSSMSVSGCMNAPSSSSNAITISYTAQSTFQTVKMGTNPTFSSGTWSQQSAPANSTSITGPNFFNPTITLIPGNTYYFQLVSSTNVVEANTSYTIPTCAPTNTPAPATCQIDGYKLNNQGTYGTGLGLTPPGNTQISLSTGATSTNNGYFFGSLTPNTTYTVSSLIPAGYRVQYGTSTSTSSIPLTSFLQGTSVNVSCSANGTTWVNWEYIPYNAPNQPTIGGTAACMTGNSTSGVGTVNWTVPSNGSAVTNVDIAPQSDAGAFSTYYNTTVSPAGATSIAFPQGFTGAQGSVNGTSIVGQQLTIVPGQTYYIRTWDGYNHSATLPWVAPAKCDQPPNTQFDSADCTKAFGWSYDPDSSSVSDKVQIFIDGALYSTVTASDPRADVNSAYGITGQHGWSLNPIPASFLNNAVHTIDIKGIDNETGIIYGANGSPKNFGPCAPPTPTPTPTPSYETIGGKVTDNNGAGIAGVTISVGGSSGGPVTATSASDGSWSIANFVKKNDYYYVRPNGVTAWNTWNNAVCSAAPFNNNYLCFTTSPKSPNPTTANNGCGTFSYEDQQAGNPGGTFSSNTCTNIIRGDCGLSCNLQYTIIAPTPTPTLTNTPSPTPSNTPIPTPTNTPIRAGWLQGYGNDIRVENPIFKDILPSADGTTTPPVKFVFDNGIYPGILFPGTNDPTLGYSSWHPYVSQTNWAAGGSSFGESLSANGLSVKYTNYFTSIQTTSNYASSTISQANIDAIAAGTTVIYKTTSGTDTTVSGNISIGSTGSTKSIVFLVDKNLIINGKIQVPYGSFLTFIVAGNITINAGIGTPAVPSYVSTANACSDPATNCDLEGFYVSDQNITVNTNNSSGCTPGADNQLNVAGLFVANAKGNNSGMFTNNRDLCPSADLNYATITMHARPDLILNTPTSLSHSPFIWKEVAP